MGGSPLTATKLQLAAHPKQPIDQHKMKGVLGEVPARLLPCWQQRQGTQKVGSV